MENINFVEESIEYLLVDEFNKLSQLDVTNLSVLRSLSVSKNDSIADNLKRILNSEPIGLMNLMFKEIQAYTIEQEVDFTSVTEIENEKYNVTIKTQIDDFSILTDVKYETVKFYYHGDEWDDLGSLDLDIVSINYFTGELVMTGIMSVNANVTTFDSIDEMQKMIRFSVMGFDEGHQKSWLENIFAGALYQEANNERMAYFSIFSGLDDFINRIYDISFSTILDNYSSILSDLRKEIENEVKAELIERKELEEEARIWDFHGEFEFDKIKIELLGYDFDEVNDSMFDELADEYDSYIASLRKEAREGIQRQLHKGLFDEEIEDSISTIDAKDYLKRVIKNYSKDRRLRERIAECSKSIKLNKNDHSVYYKLLKLFDNYEKKRHDIAHGRSLRDIPIQDFLYYALSIIMSVIYHEDFAGGGWEGYLVIDELEEW